MKIICHDDNVLRFHRDTRIKALHPEDKAAPPIPYSRNDSFKPNPDNPIVEEAMLNFANSAEEKVMNKHLSQLRVTNLN